MAKLMMTLFAALMISSSVVAQTNKTTVSVVKGSSATQPF